MVSYILITGYSILLFMNPLKFVAVIVKVLLVNLCLQCFDAVGRSAGRASGL